MIKKLIILLSITAALGLLVIFTIYSKVKSVQEENASTVQIPFEKKKWRMIEDGYQYPYRNEMLDDLRNNYNLKKLKREEIIDLLGPPTQADSTYLFYTVSQRRLAVLPIYTKSLVIRMNADSSGNRIIIQE